MLKWKADQQSGKITHSGHPSSVRPYCVCGGGVAVCVASG